VAENTIDLIIVTPERAVVHEEVDELEIPGAEGYFGVLPGHAPLFSELKVGEVGYRKRDRWFFLAVAWGFVEVLGDRVSVLADVAERAEEIDLERAKQARTQAEEHLKKGADIDWERARVSLEKAIVRIQVAQKA